MGLSGLVGFEGRRVWFTLEVVILLLPGMHGTRHLDNPLWSQGMECLLKAVFSVPEAILKDIGVGRTTVDYM